MYGCYLYRSKKFTNFSPNLSRYFSRRTASDIYQLTSVLEENVIKFAQVRRGGGGDIAKKSVLLSLNFMSGNDDLQEYILRMPFIRINFNERTENFIPTI